MRYLELSRSFCDDFQKFPKKLLKSAQNGHFGLIEIVLPLFSNCSALLEIDFDQLRDILNDSERFPVCLSLCFRWQPRTVLQLSTPAQVAPPVRASALGCLERLS